MEHKNIWVYVECSDGTICDASLELLGQGKRLATAVGQSLAAILIGFDNTEQVRTVIAYGADLVYTVQDAACRQYTAEVYTTAIAQPADSYKPLALLVGATPNGRELAARVACRLRTGLTADCTAVRIDEKGMLYWSRPAFSGNLMATVICSEARPQMGTIRPGVFSKPVPDWTRAGTCIPVSVSLQQSDVASRILEVCEAVDRPAGLRTARVIVAGGRGLGKREHFKLVEELAGVLGASVGASRAVVDSGWKTADCQIGQSGLTVAPALYIACGISGALQHMAGIGQATGIVVAINKDAEAPVFQYADYGIVGNVLKILPVLTETFRKLRQ